MADLQPTLEGEARALLKERARKVSPDLAYAIECRVADRIERMRKEHGPRVLRLEDIEPENDVVPPPAARNGRPKQQQMSDDDARVSCELEHRNHRGETKNFLWCQRGQHAWARERATGHPPSNCPDHSY